MWRFWLCVTMVAAWPWLVTAQARETYTAFAARMNAVRSDSVRFRPDLEAHVLALANSYRASRGIRALAKDSRNQMAARAHAMDMALNGFVSHVSSTGSDFDSRMRAFRPDELFLPSMGENAARVSNNTAITKEKASGLMTQWIKSGAHRRVLAGRSYSRVATAVVQKGNQLYSVQIFSGPDVKTNVRKAKATAKSIY